MKISVPKSIKKTALSAITLLIIFIAGGVLYVYLTGENSTKPRPATIPKTQQFEPLANPTPSAANAREGAYVDYVTSPASLGSNSSITINTNPNSICSINVSYNGVSSTDSGLVTKTSSAYGTVTWTWTVGDNVPLGTWPIKVTCSYHGNSAVVDSSLQVTK